MLLHNQYQQHYTRELFIKISTIEKQYGVDLGVKGNMKLGNYLTKQGYPSLSKMLKTK